MKNFGLMCLFILVCVGASRGQSCDCTITPFAPNPPCFDRCTVHLLSTTNLEDLIYILGVKEEAARRIVNWPKRNSVRRLEEYREILAPADFQDVGRRANNLNRYQLMYLRRERGSSAPLLESSDPTAMANETQSRVAREAGITKLSQPDAVKGEKTADIASAARSSSSAARGDRQLFKMELDAATYHYYKDNKGEWRWRLKIANGRIIANSAESYKTERECLDAIDRVKASASAPVTKD